MKAFFGAIVCWWTEHDWEYRWHPAEWYGVPRYRWCKRCQRDIGRGE